MPELKDMTHNLKPCPFCGDEPTLRKSQAPFRAEYMVICVRGCGACNGWKDTVDEAIAAWNTRQEPDDLIRTVISCRTQGPNEIHDTMTAICPGNKCRFYRHHEDTYRFNRETGEFVKVPNSWHCHAEQAKALYKPNRKTGGIPIGKVCWTCKGSWYQPK